MRTLNGRERGWVFHYLLRNPVYHLDIRTEGEEGVFLFFIRGSKPEIHMNLSDDPYGLTDRIYGIMLDVDKDEMYPTYFVKQSDDIWSVTVRK